MWPTGGNELTLDYNAPQPSELLTITIDIGGGQQENIQVFEGDNPFDLAKQFA